MLPARVSRGIKFKGRFRDISELCVDSLYIGKLERALRARRSFSNGLLNKTAEAENTRETMANVRPVSRKEKNYI